MSTPRTLPKISGILNNCAVHCVVPEIMDQINEFANEAKQEFQAPGAYETLKKLFGEYYALQDLTWKKLRELLTSGVNNNSLAQQLILGPVLREFMHVQSPRTGYNKLEMTDDARYPLLDAKQLSDHLCRPLDIPMVCHEAQPLALSGYVVVNHEFKSHRDTVHVYNEGHAHWERYSAADMRQAMDHAITLDRDCKAISHAYDIISHGLATTTTPENQTTGIDLLKQAVKRIHLRVLTVHD